MIPVPFPPRLGSYLSHFCIMCLSGVERQQSGWLPRGVGGGRRGLEGAGGGWKGLEGAGVMVCCCRNAGRKTTRVVWPSRICARPCSRPQVSDTHKQRQERRWATVTLLHPAESQQPHRDYPARWEGGSDCGGNESHLSKRMKNICRVNKSVALYLCGVPPPT